MSAATRELKRASRRGALAPFDGLLSQWPENDANVPNVAPTTDNTHVATGYFMPAMRLLGYDTDILATQPQTIPHS